MQRAYINFNLINNLLFKLVVPWEIIIPSLAFPRLNGKKLIPTMESKSTETKQTINLHKKESSCLIRTLTSKNN